MTIYRDAAVILPHDDEDEHEYYRIHHAHVADLICAECKNPVLVAGQINESGEDVRFSGAREWEVTCVCGIIYVLTEA